MTEDEPNHELTASPQSPFAWGHFPLCGFRPPGKPTSPDDIQLKPEQVRDFAVLTNRIAQAAMVKMEKATLRWPWPIRFTGHCKRRHDSTRHSSGIPGSLMPAFAKSAGGALTDEQIDILVREMRARWARPWKLGETRPLTPQRNQVTRSGRGAFRNILRGLSWAGRQRYGKRKFHCR